MTRPPKGSLLWEKDRSWWKFGRNHDGLVLPILTDEAPPEAVESYNIWYQWRLAESKRYNETGILA